METTYIRAKVPNSFSRRMKLLCNTLTEHDKLKEGKKKDNNFINESHLFTQGKTIATNYTTTARELSIY